MPKINLIADNDQHNTPVRRALQRPLGIARRLPAVLLAFALLLGACTTAPIPERQEPGPGGWVVQEEDSSPTPESQEQPGAAETSAAATPESSPAGSASAHSLQTPELVNPFRSAEYGFVLFYPEEGSISQQEQDYARIELPFEPDTNLVEKYLEVSVQHNKIPCTSPAAEGRDPSTVRVDLVTLGGQDYLKESGSGVATGNIYDWEAYSTANGELCVSLTYVLHSTNRANYETPPAMFDAQAEALVFEAMTDSLAWER